MVGAKSKVADNAAASSSAGDSKIANTKWGEEAHKAMIGTLLDVMDSTDIKWRAYLDQMVENLEHRGQQFSKEGIRQHLQKLKRKEGGNANGATKNATTPKKCGKAADDDGEGTPKAKRAKKSAKATPSSVTDDHDDDEDVKVQPKNEEDENDDV